MLEQGKCRSIAEIAEAEKIGRSFVSRLLRLTLLAPDIVEAILEGRQPKGMQIEELTRSMLTEWPSQRDLVAPRQPVIKSLSKRRRRTPSPAAPCGKRP
jgi:hypothetical protein